MAIQIFSDTYWSVKTCVSEGVPYFRAKDVAQALGYKNLNQAIIHNVFEEDRMKLENLMGLSERPLLKYQEKESVYITEAGVYALIFGSQKAEAKQFKKWVCQVVLPRLRKAYKDQQKAPLCLANESDLHHKIVQFLRRFYPQALLVAGLGELQDTNGKRLDAWRKGYTAGQPDLIICNAHSKYNGMAIELKNPKGIGKLSEKQDKCLEQFEIAKYKTLVSGEYDVILLEIIEYMRNIRLCCPHCCRKFKSEGTLQKHLKHFHRIN
jgi:prophage antirepressor-like protein